MSIYVCLIVFIFLTALCCKDKDPKIFLIITFLALFAVMAFRECTMVGNDSSGSYYINFKRLGNSVPEMDTNFAFFYLMKVVNIIFKDYQAFIIIEAAFVCFCYYRLISKYSVDHLISVLWYIGMLFYTFMFSALKQAFAMAILTFAFEAIMEKKRVRFFVSVGIAACFHFPALVFFPAWWISKMKMGKDFFILLAGLFAFVFVFRSKILSFMTSLYGGGDYEGVDAKFLGTKSIIMILMIIFAYVYKNEDFKDNKEFSVILVFMSVAAVFQTFCYYNNIFERLADYYYVYSVLFTPMILQNKETAGKTIEIKQSGYEFLIRVAVVAFCVWRFISYTTSGMDYLSPYVFFWQK